MKRWTSSTSLDLGDARRHDGSVHPFDEILLRTLDDGKLSRSERSAFGQILDGVQAHELALVRSRAFELARGRLEPPRATATLAWCEDVVQLVASRESARHAEATRATRSEVVFSPGEDCARRIIDLLGGARSTLEVCVFTLTDDRISDALLSAARRSVAVRVITDDAKAGDLGSDVSALVRAGIPVRTDRAESHMHHKFAIADRQLVVTGSYNWTRQASTQNQENLVVSDDPRFAAAFQREFDALWVQFGG